MLAAMEVELIDRLPELNSIVNTIYFGGGTPSILNPTNIELFIDLIRNNKELSDNVEITLECNPEDLNEHNLKRWQTIGINRLSVGVQSFNSSALKILNRAHHKAQAIAGINLARKMGYKNISIDLIFAIPGINKKDLESDIKELLALAPEHLSCYQLTIEPRTALAYQANKNKIKIIGDELSRQQFLFIHDELNAKGYHHYEISNYAKPGYESKHNSAYWTRENYLGIGPSAHSFINNKRRWNIANNAAYIKNINSTNYYSEEELTDNDRFNEKVMTGIRTIKGLDTVKLSKKLSPIELNNFLSKTKQWISNGFAIVKDGQLVLTPEGWLISDMLAAELFLV